MGKIGIATDHRGVEVKQNLTNYLKELGYNVIDYGTNSSDSVDYPDYAFALCKGVNIKEIDFGIAICKTGIGMSIACNKVKGIRCGKVNNEEEAIHGKERDFINVVAISGMAPIEENIKIVDAFLTAQENMVDPVYKKRIDQIVEYENA